jgi:uncharacterized membrane protein
MRKQKDKKGKAKEAPTVARPPTPKHLRVGLMARLRNYFLAGILVTAPVSITIWIAWNLIGYIDDRVTPLIPPRWNPETYLPFGVPGLGVVAMVVVLILVGFFAAGLIGRMVMRRGEAVLARVPVVRSVYSGTKQIFETILAQQSNAFRQVCLIEYPRRGTWAVGFVTGETVGEVQRLTGATVINVFIPATPNPTTGFLLFVPEPDVHVLDITVEEGIKLVISGGIVEPGQARPGGDWDLADILSPKGPQKKAKVEVATKSGDGEARPKPHRASLAVRLRNYFLAGVLVTAPISITLWLVWKFISFVDNRVVPLIPAGWNPETYLPFDVPGLGLVVSAVGLMLIGFFAAGFAGRLVMRTGEKMMAQVPVVRSIYSALKQIFETVFAQKTNALRQVVLIQYPRPEVWAIGFLTGQTQNHIPDIAQAEVVNVFLPTTPNPTSGFLLFEPKERAALLDMTVEEGLKMVVSGGIVTPPDRGTAKAEEPDEAAEPPHPAANPTAPAEAD